MLERSRSEVVKESAAAASALAARLAADKEFQQQLLAAAEHGLRAQQRVQRRLGLAATVSGLAADQQLRSELLQATRALQAARGRLTARRSHRLRNSLLLTAAAGAAAAAVVPQSRQRLRAALRALAGGGAGGPRALMAELEVTVPVTVAYNQWTQFEQFPQFMQGVEEVRQLDPTRLHWVVRVAGKRAEWDAKILEQHPDQQISWISEDGRKTRGTVSFESLATNRTLVRLSMSYQAEGLHEALAAALGLDQQRVRGDLERFKRLVESGASTSDGWRGDITHGATT